MAKKLISFNFNTGFCPELSSNYGTHSINDVDTIYRTTPNSMLPNASIKTDAMLAELICNYAGIINTYNHLFVGVTNDGCAAEFRRRAGDDLTIVVAKNGPSGVKVFAQSSSDDTTLSPYDPAGHRGTGFFAALLPMLLEDQEAKEFMDNLMLHINGDNEFSQALCGLSNNFYYRMKDTQSTDPVVVDESDYNNFDLKFIDEPIIYVSTANQREPFFFKVDTSLASASASQSSAPTLTNNVSASLLRDMYLLDEERELTEEEEARVPDLGDYYVVPEWAVKTAKRIKDSRRFRKGINNILLYGPSGTGKTEGAQAIAEMLGLPYYSLTCSADDDKFDLIGQLIPNVNKDVSEMISSMDVTFEDIENDFEESFKKLFGRNPGALDSVADAYAEVAKRIAEKDSEQDFTYVESELIQAIKYGGFCEIQEANIIKRSSVMEALNPLLQGAGGFIKLPTGEVITRHPDCIIVMTINRDYEGCNNLQEAVLSRINYVKQINEPTVDELFARTKAQTGFKNDTMLKKMAQFVADAHAYCRENDITSGVCGPRELMDWAENTILESEDRGEVKITEDSVIISALDTVLEKVSQDAEDVEDVIAGVFKKYFSVSKLDKIRSAA